MEARATQGGASIEAVQAHYDTGNEFYRLWLDPTLTYSCALWGDGDSLLDAQQRKLDFHIEQARAAGARRVLDIGCGWGSMLRRLVERHGVQQAVGLTLSAEQARHVREQGPAGSEVRLESWREHRPSEPYDAIVSLGALEHFVRPEMSSDQRVRVYRELFEACQGMLVPAGRMSLQTIAYGVGSYRRGAFADIFPESDLPRLWELARALDGLFHIVTLRNDAEHYARTIGCWRDAFEHNRERIEALVGEDRTTAYERYLRAGVKGFEHGVFHLYRLALRDVRTSMPA